MGFGGLLKGAAGALGGGVGAVAKGLGKAVKATSPILNAGGGKPGMTGIGGPLAKGLSAPGGDVASSKPAGIKRFSKGRSMAGGRR